MSNSLVVSERLNDTLALGQIMADSRMFADATEQAKAIVKIIAGQEMGIGAVAAMTGIHVIKGRVQVGANLMANAVKSHPKYDYRVRKMDNQEVILEFFEGGESLGFSSFTIEDARKAGTQNLDRFPRNMLFARAISNGIKWFCPDALNGNTAYVPEELDNEPKQSGWVVEQPVTEPVTPQEKVIQATPETIQLWLNKLNALPQVNGYYKHANHLRNALKLESFPATFHNGDMQAWQAIKEQAIEYVVNKQNDDLDTSPRSLKHFEAELQMLGVEGDEFEQMVAVYHNDADTAWDMLGGEAERLNS